MPHQYEKVSSYADGEEILPMYYEDELADRSKLYLFCLTISIGGLQVVWATVMAQGPSYLTSLGLSQSIVSLVWLAGPICGTVLQPYIGYKSDSCTHRWGRRRPFMIYGTAATIACINALAWTSEGVRLICNGLNVSDHDFGAKLVIQVLAIAGVWALNISIQPVQTSIRALIVDACPRSQAARASSFASFAVIVGSAIGYGCAFIEMPKGSQWIQNSQFKGLCLIASMSLGITVTITSIMIEERTVDAEDDEEEPDQTSARQVFSEITTAIRTLPPTIRKICVVQFFAWLAWFPFLFNTVPYLSRLYEAQTLLEKMGPPSTMFYNALRQQSIRHATLAMLVFSIVALIANLSLPYIIIDKNTHSDSVPAWREQEQLATGRVHFPVEWRTRSQARLTLPRAWTISHVITALALLAATLGDGFMTSVVFISFLGVSWTLTQWAPFAMISAEIASSSSSEVSACASNMEKAESATLRPKAGVTMAIHNIAIATPQMLSAVLAALIFWVCKQLQIGETDAMRWVMRMGTLAGGCAAWYAGKL